MDLNLCYMRMTSSFTGLSILQMTMLRCSMMLILGVHAVPSNYSSLIHQNVHRRLKRSEPSPLFLNGSLIEAVDCIKYLGISIASDLSWSQHIQSITSKAKRLVGLLFRQYYHYADTNVPMFQSFAHTWSTLFQFGTPIQPRIVISLHESVQRFAGRVCLKSWDIGYSEILNSFNINYPYSTRNVHNLSFCNLHGHICTPVPPLIFS